MTKTMSVLALACAGMMMLLPTAVAQSKANNDKAMYSCEGGKKIMISGSPEADSRITVNWNKRNHTLTRIDTTTGANRFENKKVGLVWINIPAKGMLLDSRKGQQLANGCKA